MYNYLRKVARNILMRNYAISVYLIIFIERSYHFLNSFSELNY